MDPKAKDKDTITVRILKILTRTKLGRYYG
jgi:hypothetical protein